MSEWGVSAREIGSGWGAPFLFAAASSKAYIEGGSLDRKIVGYVASAAVDRTLAEI